MSTLSAKEYKCFEDIKRIRPDGSEYWAARELAPVLDYAKWENFYKVIKRAMIACENSGRSTSECFPEVRKTSPMPNGGVKDILDYELSRYACYLIVQNGDPRKEVIALGQTYFAIQTYTPSLSFMDSGDDGVVTTLRIEVKHLDPEKLMDELGFDSEARQWAGALYETLEESDAINKYKSYYEAYQPGYGGDGPYSGDVEYGSGYDNEIDISGFVDPSTKNNLDLAAYAIQAWANNWGYVWGTYGNVLTPALFEYKKQQYPDGVGNYADFIKEHWLGRRTADCIGLIKGYGWLDTKSMTIRYATNGMPDYGADQMYHACKNAGTLNKDYGTVSTMPEIPGLMLWKSGHAGVYIGGGYAIEAMGTSKGVVKTKVSDRNWQGWGKLPYIDYREGN